MRFDKSVLQCRPKIDILVFNKSLTWLSFRLEVGGNILKVDGYGGRPTGDGSAYFVITFLGRKANNSEISSFTFQNFYQGNYHACQTCSMSELSVSFRE